MTTRSVLASILLIAAAGPFRLSAQTIKVNSANPNSYEQGTTSLDVTIGGSGFAKGAKSSLNLTGTTDTGGVTVNSTSFISSNQLTANITVPTTAVIGSYDILVTNTNGRTGKGTGLASVISNKVCTLSPLPSGITLVGTMNPVAAFSGGLGSAIRMRHMKVGAKDVLVAGVGSSASGNLEVFFLDAATGNVLDGTNIFSGTSPQPHITKPINYTGFGARNLAMGDLNADGVPDIVMADWDYGVAFAFVGSLSANGIVGYSGPIAFPSVPGRSLRFGTDTSMSDMDGLPGDEVVVADGSYSDKRNKQTGGVFVFKYNNGSPGDAGSFNLLWYMGNPASSAASGMLRAIPTSM